MDETTAYNPPHFEPSSIQPATLSDAPATAPPDAPASPNANATSGASEFLALAQQERLMRHLGDLVARTEASAQAERDAERRERREQQQQLVGAMGNLAGALTEFSQNYQTLGREMDELRSEVKTLRAAILLAHSIGREEGASSPLGLDVAKGPAFTSDPFAAFPVTQQTSHSSQTSSGGQNSGAPKKTRVISPEARAKISAAQKLRWARERGEI